MEMRCQRWKGRHEPRESPLHFTLTGFCFFHTAFPSPSPWLSRLSNSVGRNSSLESPKCCSQPPQIGIWRQTTETCFLARERPFIFGCKSLSIPSTFPRQTQTDCNSLDGGEIADGHLGALCALAAELAGNASKSPKRCAAQLSGGMACRSALPNTKAEGFSPVSVLYKLIGCP